MATGWIRRLLCSIAVICAVVLGVQGTAGADSAYGSGSYGNCLDSGSCAPATTATVTPTVVAVSPGLEVAINLTDGQKLPRSSYAVTVTPVGAQDVGIGHVDISIDGQLAASSLLPDATTGAVRWVWDVLSLPGSVVTVAVTDTNGQTSTSTYHVQIVEVSAVAHATSAPEAAATTSEPAAAASIPRQYLNKATHFVGRLPKPVIRTFPYVLFLILLGNVVLLGLQMQHELREYGVAKRLLARQREVADAKRVLLELISHYLRTPLTLLAGGIEMLKAQPAQQTLDGLRQSLADKTERLIAQARDAAAVVDELPVVRGEAPSPHMWLHPALFMPMVLIGLVVAVFDYLAHRAGALNVSQTNVLVQVLSFFTLVMVTYFTFRYLHLRRRDAHELERTAVAETAVMQARDDLVSETSGLLQQDVERLGTLVGGLPPGEAAGFIKESHERLAILLQKVQQATGLRSAHSAGAITATPLDQLLQQASASIAKRAAEHRIVLPAGNQAPVPSRDPQLLQAVVASVLDNAVAYSPDDAVVEAAYRTVGHDVELTITDHGDGIPMDRLHDLFLPFQKLEGVDTFNHEGMGFSLYLDRLIMTYLGGSIAAASPASGGTVVTLVLPGRA